MRRLPVSLLLLCATLLPAAGVDVQLTVSLVNPGTPVLVFPAQVQAAVGVPFSLDPGLVNGPATFFATGLPPGLSIDPATGVISGTPTTPGNFEVTVTATNADGSSTWQLAILVHSGVGGTTNDQFGQHGFSGHCGAGRGLATLFILLPFALGLGRRRG
jgi:hypothetical protein